MRLSNESGLVIRPGGDVDGAKVNLKRGTDLLLVAEKTHEALEEVMGVRDESRVWINHPR
jgi:hypothetical protein